MIRSALNTYSHCTPEQVNWNIYLESTQDNCCTMELNTKPMVININAYYIDRYICIHFPVKFSKNSITEPPFLSCQH